MLHYLDTAIAFTVVMLLYSLVITTVVQMINSVLDLGVLASVLLLSLGAPFWYNTLRKLSSLKPAIARKVSGQETAGEETSTAPQAPASAKAAG